MKQSMVITNLVNHLVDSKEIISVDPITKEESNSIKMGILQYMLDNHLRFIKIPSIKVTRIER